MVVADLDEDGNERVAGEIRELGAGASAITVDVTDEVQVAAMVEHAQRTFGGLHVLVNNAGGYELPVFMDAEVEHWSRALDLNLRAPMLATHHAVRAMAARGGAIVNIASSAGLGFAAHPGPEYAVAKAGLLRLTACLAPLAERGVRVNCVCPHTVRTEAVQETIAELTRRGEELPLPLRGELVDPDDVADATVALIRDETLAGRVVVLRGGGSPQMLPALDWDELLRELGGA